MKLKDKLPVVYVEWDDSESIYGWRELEKNKPEKIRSVGILANKNNDGVTLSTSKTAYDKYVDQIWIPKSAIRKFRKVKI
jgi:hypothetical protein